jgi:isopropylmalate/homocitrate/citramalate synthase
MTSEPGGMTFDWDGGGDAPPPPASVDFDDETLRDGLQSPSVQRPRLDERIRFLELAAAVGISSADVGMPGAGAFAAAETEALCRAILERRLPIAPNCAARATEVDIAPILEIGQRVGTAVEVALFLPSSPVRRFVEGWTLAEVAGRVERWVGFAARRGAPVTFVAEDATRSAPDDLARIMSAAVGAGAGRICLADTVGQATPLGAFRLAAFARRTLDGMGAAAVGLDWHGHDDRGLAVASALAAAGGGAGRLHATALGVGERAGNPAIEQLLVNVRLLGWGRPDLSGLAEYAAHASGMLGVAIPPGAPVVGRDAFRTSTGVHAAAVVKASRAGGDALADLVYSAVPAAWLGRAQEIEVGPMSGVANVRSWLARNGLRGDAATVARILAAAKAADRTLSDDELRAAAAQPVGGAR